MREHELGSGTDGNREAVADPGGETSQSLQGEVPWRPQGDLAACECGDPRATAATVLVAEARVPAPGLTARVIEAGIVVTVFPPASSTATSGWVANAVPPVEADGGWVKASWAAAPVVTLKAVLVAESATRRWR